VNTSYQNENFYLVAAGAAQVFTAGKSGLLTHYDNMDMAFKRYVSDMPDVVVSLTGSGQNVTFYESLDPVLVDANLTLTGESFDGAKVSISQGFISGSECIALSKSKRNCREL
jgi:hypothetical protein